MQRNTAVRKSSDAPAPPRVTRRLLKDYEVEAQYGISRFTLRADRVHGRRFKFIKIGRSVYYRVEDIESVLDNHVIDGLVDQ
jgi:predicted DNA-binding transcriptional regulator AlpA